MRPLPLELLALISLIPFVGIWHELGHALIAPLAGYRVTSLGLGAGRPLIRRLARDGVALWLGRWPLAGGICVAVPATLSARPALFQAGGLLAQVLLAWLLHRLAPEHWVAQRGEVFNLLVLAWNAVPWRWRDNASDGWYLLARLRGRGWGRPLLGDRAGLDHLLAFERAVGSPVGAWYASLGLAWVAHLVGRPEEAVELAMAPLPRGLRPRDHGLRALAALLQAAVLGAAGRTDEVVPPDGDAIIGLLAQSRLALDRGRPEEVADLLAPIAHATGALGREVAALRAEAAIARGAPDLPQALLALEAALPGPFLDPVRVARTLHAAAERP
ncbi:MAG: site-2 protease family protein, partial [Pseudomonadota bacterium]